MSPSQKTQDSPSSSPAPDIVTRREERTKPRKSSTTTTITPPRSSSIPTLPDVHKAPSTGPQGNFLQSLLMEDKLQREEEKENEEEKEERRKVQEKEGEWSNNTHSSGSSTSGRSGVSKKKGKVAGQEGQGHRLSIPDDRSAKTLTPETLNARSDKTLTASWSGAAENSPRGQRRRRSRDGGTSGRRLSGPVLPFKKKFKQRLSHDSAAASQRRYSSPATSSLVGSSKLLDLRLKSGGGSVLSLEEEVSSMTESESANVPPLDSEKCISDSAHSENPGKDSSDSEKATDSDKVLPDIDEHGSGFTKVASDPKGMQTLQSEKSHSDKTSSPSTATGMTPVTSGSAQVTATAPSAALTPSTQKNPPSSRATEDKAPEPSQAFNQWTSCRALEDSDDDNDNDNEDNDNNRTSEMDSHDFHSFDHDGYASDGLFSRVGSSNPSRRKRPLLLPPIMLPPLHTAKPTPMVLRDEVYFATVGSRARRSLSEEEWEKLKDCRYLRIPRQWRRPLKV